MKKKRGKPVRTSDEEDNLEVDYEPSDSDQELDEDDKLILRKTRRQIQGADGSDSESEEEVMGLKSSDESDEDDEDDEDDKEGKGEDSDEEDSEDDESFDEDEDNDVLGDDEGNLPDPKAWGQKRKNYYNTDYVDQDFGGFQNEKEEEAALMEEEEARTIQRRLAEQLDDLDPVLTFATLGDLTKVVDVDDDKREVIETDFSQMNKRDRMVLLEKESPEFLGFIQDFQNYLDCVQNNLLSIIDALKVEQLPSSPASQFVLSMTQLIMNYLTNISFYLLLKARNSNVKNHPVLKQLLQYKELLKEMEPVFQKQIQPQLDSVLEKIKDFDFDGPSENIKSSKKRKLLNLLSSKMVGNKKQDEGSKKTKKDITEDFSDILPQEGSEGSEDTGSESDAEISEKVVENKLNESNPEESKATDKRAITYQIAKNKGLTPRRKKENRNPRVKLKNKFRKAKIRRKGQIPEVRRELKRYGGEASGIKASVSKSIKIKY